MSLIPKVKSFIHLQKLFHPGDVVVAGLSGGADSVALVCVLNELKHELALKIIVAHFNHRLRPEADAEEAFAQNLAASMNLPFFTGYPLQPLPSAGGSLEEAAREVRLGFLMDLAGQHGASAVALGHHRDDLAETVLMRILRGTGLQGFQAIRPSRVLRKTRFVRPLLDVTRAEIEAFLSGRSQAFCHDQSNDQTDFFRNRVRLELLPLLKKHYNPNIVAALANLSETLSEDYEFLDDVARRAMETMTARRSERGLDLSLPDFQAQPAAMQKMILRLAARELAGSVTQIDLAHWKEVSLLMSERPDQSVVSWPSGIRIQKDQTRGVLSVTKA